MRKFAGARQLQPSSLSWGLLAGTGWISVSLKLDGLSCSFAATMQCGGTLTHIGSYHIKPRPTSICMGGLPVEIMYQ